MRRRAVPYSDAEMVWLEANRTLVISDYHRAFVEAFGREDVSAKNLHSLRKRKGWKVGRAPGRTKGRRLRYSAAEIEWLQANCTLPISDYRREFCSLFDRDDVTEARLHGLRKREGWRTGRTGRFQTGQPSTNKGKVCPPGTGGRHPNAQRTQFQKGSRTGRAANIYQPIGTERVTDDGYRARKIHDGLPMHSRWRFVHQIEWEALNGPVPEGMALKCLSGNKSDTSPSNWEPIPRGVLARLNGGRLKKRIGFDAAPPEMKPTLMAMAKLEHAAYERQKARTA